MALSALTFAASALNALDESGARGQEHGHREHEAED
jgi:hypothetical protein